MAVGVRGGESSFVERKIIWGAYIHHLGPEHPIAKYLGSDPAFHPDSEFLLTWTLESSRFWLKCVDPCRPSGWQAQMQFLAPGFDLVQHWLLGHELVDEGSLSLK